MVKICIKGCTKKYDNFMKLVESLKETDLKIYKTGYSSIDNVFEIFCEINEEENEYKNPYWYFNDEQRRIILFKDQYYELNIEFNKVEL